MKKSFSSFLKKAKKGESSYRHSHQSDEGSHGRREDEEGSHQHVVQYVPLPRAIEPESGLLLSVEELQRYRIIRETGYAHTSIIDPVLLNNTGMDVEFNTVFSTIGWGGFWQVPELGIKVLTQEFLCTLKTTNDGVAFRMFENEYNLTWSTLNTALGCDHDCDLDLDHATRRFRKDAFWKAISGSDDCSDPKTTEIHNPTLCFLHYWIIFTLFPGTKSDNELKVLYAMTNKIRMSPIKLLVNFWLSAFDFEIPIYFTSLITRIAETLGLLESNTFEYIAFPRDIINEEMFIEVQVLKRDSRGQLKMIYPGHTAEVPLPCERRRLYVLRTLTLKLDQEARGQSTAGTSRMTRSMTRAAQMEEAGPSQPAGDNVEEGDEASSMDISESMGRPPHPQHTPRVGTPRPRGKGRRHQRTDVDNLIDDMGTLSIEQQATLELAQQNAQYLQAMQDEEAQRWAAWFQYYPPPQ